MLKLALITYANQLSRHWGDKGIRVNCVSPNLAGLTGYDWNQAAPHLLDTLHTQQLLDRFGTKEELARAIVFLASSASNYITGANLVVDGSFSKRIER